MEPPPPRGRRRTAAATAASPTSSGCPRRRRPGPACWSSTAPARARRTTPTSPASPRAAAGRRSPTTSAATASPRVRCRRPRSATPARWRGCSAGVEGVDASRVCARGSSLGGFVAIHAAATSDAIAGAIAICPAAEEPAARGDPRAGGWRWRLDETALVPWLEEHDLRDAVGLMGGKPLILLHAAGDDRSRALSEELYERAPSRASWSWSPAGTTARFSTTPSCRPWRCAGWSARCRAAER